MENWKDVKGFEPYFQVSDQGRVFSKRTGIILSQNTTKRGYLVINTRIGGKTGIAYSLRVHRLVAEAFLPEPPDWLVEKCSREHHGKVIVRHKDSNKKNNLLSNLEWGDSQSNTNDYMTTETFFSEVKRRSGVNNKWSKLDNKDISKILEMRAEGHTYKSLGEIFGVAHSTIGRVVRGNTYKHELVQIVHGTGSDIG